MTGTTAKPTTATTNKENDAATAANANMTDAKATTAVKEAAANDDVDVTKLDAAAKLAVIKDALTSASSSPAQLAKAWTDMTRSQRLVILNGVADKLAELTRKKEEEDGVLLSVKAEEFEKSVLHALAKRLSSMTPAKENTAVFNGLLKLADSAARGDPDGEAAQLATHDAFTMLWPLFQEVDEEAAAKCEEEDDDNEDEDGDDDDDDEEGNVGRFQGLVRAYGVMLSLYVNFESLTHACGGVDCDKRETSIGQFSQCAGCKSVRYCSKPCQVSDWKSGGHKTACKQRKAEAAAVEAAEDARVAAYEAAAQATFSFDLPAATTEASK